MTKKCYVKFAGSEVIQIDPKVTFILFNELIEKNIKFEFINAYPINQITYSFYIYSSAAAEKVKAILKEVEK